MSSYTFLDYMIVLIVTVPIIIGLVRGFFRAVLGLIGVITGTALAVTFSRPWGNVLSSLLKLKDPFWGRIAMFILIFAICYLSAILLAVGFRKLFQIIKLGWLERLLGGIFGGIKGFITVSVMILLILTVPVLKPFAEDSQLARPIFNGMNTMYLALPLQWQKYLDPGRWLGTSRMSAITTSPQPKSVQSPVTTPLPARTPATKQETTGLE